MTVTQLQARPDTDDPDDGAWLRRRWQEADQGQREVDLLRWECAQRCARMQYDGMSQRAIADAWGTSQRHVVLVLRCWAAEFGSNHLATVDLREAVNGAVPSWSSAYKAAKAPRRDLPQQQQGEGEPLPQRVREAFCNRLTMLQNAERQAADLVEGLTLMSAKGLTLADAEVAVGISADDLAPFWKRAVEALDAA